MKIISKKVFIALAAIFVCSLAMGNINVPVAEYRKRLLGDNAFNSGLYDVAMNYYKNYLKDADGNSPAIRDAYYCLIATCLRSNNLTEAQRLYNELKLKFQYYFSSSPDKELVLEYWNAEIQLKKGDISNATVIFENIVKNVLKDQLELKTDALIGLGICKIRQEKWDEAKTIFKKLSKISTVDAKSIAIQQLVYINVIQGNIKEAKKLLKDTIENHKQLTLKLDLLKLCSLIEKNKLDEAQKEYSELKLSAEAPDPIWYITATTLANSYIINKEYKKAIPLLEDASIMAPNLFYKEKTSLNLIKTLYKAKETEKATKTALFFLDNFPRTAIRDKILLLLIQIMLKEKKFNEIATYASKYFLFDKTATQDKTQIAQEVGKILFYLKNYEEADKYFSYIVNNETAKQEKEIGQYWKAKALIAQNKFKDALSILQKLETENDDLQEKAKFKIIEVYIKQENYQKAVQDLKLFITQYPESKLTPSPLFLYAIMLKRLGKTNDAISKLQYFAEKNQNNPLAPLAYLEAGYLCVLQNNYLEAKKMFNKILTQYKDSAQTPDALYWLLYTSYLDGNSNSSEEYADSLLKHYPSSAFTKQALEWQINYYINNKKYTKAIASLKTLEAAFSDQPDMISETIYMKAYVLFKERKIEEALNTLKELEDNYSTTPVLAKCLFLKGDILASKGEYLDAVASYLKSTQVTDNPSINTAAWGRVGDCYFAMVNYIKEKDEKEDSIYKAIEYYDKILAEEEISPLFRIQTLYKLGKCYELLDKPEEAIAKYHEAVYGDILNNDDISPCREWFAKSGIALARLLQDKHSPIAAEAAISVYKTLIKYNIQPKQDFEQRIKEISKNYKLKE